MANSKLPVSSSSISSTTGSGSGIAQPLLSDVTSALLSAGAIPRIQAVLYHELASAGWTTNLRTFVLQLLRSGDCTTYDEIMTRVLAEAKGQDTGSAAHGVNGVNGTAGDRTGPSLPTGKSVEEGGIRIPPKVIREGVKTVKKELESVCEITLEGE